MPRTEVIKQVKLNAHLRPMMSTRIPQVNAPRLGSDKVLCTMKLKLTRDQRWHKKR